jgi:Tol biopolymer transport system component
VFTADNGDEATIWAVRPDGTGLQQITDAVGPHGSAPDWRP